MRPQTIRGALPRRFAHLAAYTVALLLVGIAVSTQWRSFEARPAHVTRYSLQLTDTVREMQREQDRLKAQLAELRRGLEAVQSRSASFGGEGAELKRQIDELSPQAGLVALAGPGVTVTLDDAKLPATARDVARAIIHSTDVTDVINTAWKGGAEAIAINGERISGTSACVGAVIQINGRLMSPPFVFSVIGPTDRLMAVFSTADELAELKQRSTLYGLGFSVARATGVRVPAFSGPLTSHYAKVR